MAGLPCDFYKNKHLNKTKNVNITVSKKKKS